MTKKFIELRITWTRKEITVEEVGIAKASMTYFQTCKQHIFSSRFVKANHRVRVFLLFKRSLKV